MCIDRAQTRTLGWVRWIVRCFCIGRHEHKLVSSIDCQTSYEGVRSTADGAVLEFDLHSPRRRSRSCSYILLYGLLYGLLRLAELQGVLFSAVVEMELVQREVCHCARMRNKAKKLGRGLKW